MAEQLKLQVILDAADKFTAPIRRAMSASESFETQLKSTKAALQGLQGQSADIAAYRKLTSQITDTAASLVLAENKVSKYQGSIKESHVVQQKLSREFTRSEIELSDLKKQMDATENPSKKLVQNFNEAQETVKTLNKRLDQAETDTQNYTAKLTKSQQSLTKTKEKHDNYNKVLGETKKRLNDAGISTKNLASHESRLKTEIDQTTQSLEKQAGQLKKVADQQKQLNKLRNFKNRSMQRASNMTIQGGGAMYAGQRAVRGAMQPATVAMDFEEQMSKVQALTRLNVEVVADKAQFDALKQQALDLGSSTSFSASQAASAQGFLAMAGFDPEKIKQSMPGMLNLAKAAGAELATTADIGSNILSGFRLDADQMDRVGDVLTATFTRSNVDLSMLGESMKYAAPVAAELEISLEDTAAMAGLLGNVGIQASMAGTSMRGIFNRMASPPKAAKDALAEIDVKTADAAGNMRAVPEILAEIATKTESMGNAQRMAIFKAVAGTEAGSAMATLVAQEGAEGITKFAEVLKNSGGEAERVAKVMGDNTKGRIKEMQSAWEGLMITVGDQLSPVLNELLIYSTQVINKVKAWSQANPELAATLTKVAVGAAVLVTGFGALAVGAAAIMGPLAIMRYGISALGLRAGGAGRSIGLLSGVFKYAGTAAKTLFRILAMHPLGRLVAIIGGAAYTLWKNWGSVKGKFSGYWDATKAKWSEFSNWWSNTSFKEKSLQVSAKDMEMARNAGASFTSWWSGSTFAEKALSLKSSALALAKSDAIPVLGWWNKVNLTEKQMALNTTGVTNGKALVQGVLTWWSGLSLNDLTPHIGVTGVETAKAKYQELSNWWNTTSLTQKAMDIVTTPATIARSLVRPVFNWWNNEALTEKQMALNTTGVTNGKATIQTVLDWWSSVGIKDRLIAFQQGPLQSSITGIRAKVNSLLSWWDTVDLHDIGYGVGSFIRKALKTIRSKAQEFMTWWNNLSLKSLMPEIKMPTIAGIKKAISGGSGGIASSVGKAASSVAKGASNFVGGLFSGLRGDPKPDGSRASGGPVLSGSFYRVNELGPELLNMQGSTYLMMGGAGGHITPLGQAGVFQSLQNNASAEAANNNTNTTNSSRYANTSKTLNSSMMKNPRQAQTSQASVTAKNTLREIQQYQQKTGLTTANDSRFNASTIERESHFSDQKVIDLLTRSSQAESLVTSRKGGSGSNAPVATSMPVEINIHPSPGASPQDIAREVRAEMERFYQEKQREAERRTRSQLFDEVG